MTPLALPQDTMKLLTFLLIPLLAFGQLPLIDFSMPYDHPQAPSVQVSSPSFLDGNKILKENPFGDVKYHSGYLNVGKEGGEMFYWYFLNTQGDAAPNDTPFIIWLTGGPGCSSELAALTENGPLMVQPDLTLKKNAYTWSSVADVVYIDQPLGTGFSSAGDPRNYVTNETVIAQDMREFLEQFIDLYPKLKQRPFFITGESYAGHYIPSVAHKLLKDPIEGLNLKGVAIGNGWVDPRAQYPAYADFAFEHNMVGQVGYRLAQKGLEGCIKLIDQGLWPLAIVQCNSIVSGLLGKRNPYDVRLNCDVPPMCYNTTALDSFMNTESVQRELGVHKKWKECNALVYMLMLGDWITQMGAKVGELLSNGKQVLVYNGDQDFICNWLGGQKWVENVKWSKQEEFLATDFVTWNVDGKPAGEMRKVDNLTFLRVYDAGHMVPMDQPKAALAMISQFLSGGIENSKEEVEHFQKKETNSDFSKKFWEANKASIVAFA